MIQLHCCALLTRPPGGLGKQTLDELDRKAKDFGVSHWEAIKVITEQGDGFGARAISALKNFQKIVEDLISYRSARTGIRSRQGRDS
ncbi:MAG: hypothetical protein WKF84_23480 [Pyrinomonadaceae bacterium]